jgi:hypothetical protein
MLVSAAHMPPKVKMNLQHTKCSGCGKKGLHYAGHPHAYGWKDTSVITCRFCHGRFDAEKVEARIKREEAAADRAGLRTTRPSPKRGTHLFNDDCGDGYV